LLHAEISDDVGVFVGLAKEINLTIGDAEASGQHAFDCHVAVVETAPGKNMSSC